NSNRINDTAVLGLAGGTLNMQGGAGVASSETLGGVVFLSGHSTVQTTAGSGGSVLLTANAVNRLAGATANLVAGGGQTLGMAANQIIINVAPSLLLANGIIKGITVTDAATGGFNLATATGSTTASVAALTSYQTLSTTGGNA